MNAKIEQNTKHVWSNWATNNKDGNETDHIEIPSTARIVGLEVQEQSGYGLVNARLIYVDDNGQEHYTNHLTSNPDGKVQRVKTSPETTVEGVEVREQSNYGLVNARLIITGGVTEWITTNMNGSPHKATVTKVMTGFQGREQSNYGLIDLRVCGLG